MMSLFKQVPATKVRQGRMVFLHATHSWFSSAHLQLVCTQDSSNIPCLATRRVFTGITSWQPAYKPFAPEQMLKFLSRKLDSLLHNQVLLKTNLKINPE